jgi:hypothetical protein
MRSLLQSAVLTALISLCEVRCLAQSNVYSISVYAGGVSSSSILVVGSYPRQFGIWRCSYWTDTNGYTVFYVGNPGRKIQPSDKLHVYTQISFGSRSFSIPISPIFLAILVIVGILVLGLLFIALRYRNSTAGRPKVPSGSP